MCSFHYLESSVSYAVHDSDVRVSSSMALESSNADTRSSTQTWSHVPLRFVRRVFYSLNGWYTNTQVHRIEETVLTVDSILCAGVHVDSLFESPPRKLRSNVTRFCEQPLLHGNPATGIAFPTAKLCIHHLINIESLYSCNLSWERRPY